MNRLKTIFKILLAPFIVFVVHIILIISLRIYATYPWFDIPMHAIGGLAISISAILFINMLQKEKHLGKTSPFVSFIFTISLVSLAAILWEFAEFILDATTPLNSQPSLEDTILDLFMGLLGGVLGFLTFKK